MTSNVGDGNVNVNIPQLGSPDSALMSQMGETTVSAAKTIADIRTTIAIVGDDGSVTHQTLRFIYSGNNPEVLANLDAGRPVLDSAFIFGVIDDKGNGSFLIFGNDIEDTEDTESASSTASLSSRSVDDSETTTGSENVSAASSAASTSAPQGNAFLTPNMMVAVTVNMMLLADAMKDFKMIDLAIKMMAIAVVWEIAQTQASLAMEMAETKAQQHMALAVSAGIQMVGQMAIGVVGAVGASGMAGSKFQGAVVHGGLTTAGSHAMSSAGQIADNVIQALSTLEQGRIERDQKLYEGMSQIAQQMMQEAFKDFETLQQLVQQILDKLAGIQQQNSQANTQG